MRNKTLFGALVIVGITVIAGSLVYAFFMDKSMYDSSGESHSRKQSSPSGGVDIVKDPKIEISNFEYSPKLVTVKQGTTVTWTNRDGAEHNVVSDDKVLDGPLLAKGESWSFTFSDPGTYEYYCLPHPHMKAVVKVIE